MNKKSNDNRTTEKKQPIDIFQILIIIFFCILLYFIIKGPDLIIKRYIKGNGYILLKANDTLTYFGTCISAIGTIFLGLITLYLNNKIEKNNKEMQEKLYELECIKNCAYCDLIYTGTREEKEFEPKYNLKNQEELSLEYSIHREGNKITKTPYKYKLNIINDQSEINSIENKCFTFKLINKSDEIICLINPIHIRCSIGKIQKEYKGDKVSTTISETVNKNGIIPIELEIISNDNLSDEMDHNLYDIIFQFKISTLNGLSFKQYFHLEFNDNELIDKSYLPVEVITEEKINKSN